MELFYVIVALIAGSVGSVGLAALMLLLPDRKLDNLATLLMYLAGGTLLGAAFLGMMPKGISMIGARPMLLAVLGGIMFFFALEKIILWRTCGNAECERHKHAAVPIILIGDAFHNAIDGIVIAASFLTSFATLSVMMHEIPQELGDFGILLKSGLSRKKAIWFNVLSGSTALLTGIIAYYTLEAMQSLIPYALALSAASFLYIALADLIPEMHRKSSVKSSLIQFGLILTGILLIYIILIIK
jgi:zinc and cadmium transporter